MGVEHIPELVELAKANLGKSEGGKKLLGEGRVRVEWGDGREGWGLDGNAEGKEEEWDVVHVGAAAERVGEGLLGGLRRGGR